MTQRSGAEERLALRREVLARAGARGPVMDELLAFNAPTLPVADAGPQLDFPLADEPHLEIWREYLSDVAHIGAMAALAKRLVQLCFPIRAGISESDAYRAATRRGDPVTSGLALELVAPEQIRLDLQPSLGGTVPVLTAGRREDFVALVRALSARNEPVPVPESMGACLVSGLVNWDRVRRHRRAWEAAHPEEGEEGWRQEFAAMKSRKELYQDRVILLSRGPYSGLDASSSGLSPAQWQASSQLLRLTHEATHYLTLRVFGKLQHNVLEELVADFAGLIQAFGTYRADLARAFLGIESLPHLRPAGRLANYRGTPPLSAEAWALEAVLVDAAIHSLTLVASRAGEALTAPVILGSLVCALVTCSLEELASAQAPELVTARLASALAGPAP